MEFLRALSVLRLALLTALITVAWFISATGWLKLAAIIFPLLWLPGILRRRHHRVQG